MTSSPAVIVFTDLDGTLLDHDTYRYDAALPAIDQLHERGISLVLASSKTATEMMPLRRALGFNHCVAIVENGAGTLPPYGEADATAAQYSLLQETITDCAKELRQYFTGFGELSVEQVADLTGLEPLDAGRAKEREFSEPGIWEGDEAQLAEFLRRLEAANVFAKRGGRFLTLSFGGNKAEKMLNIVRQYEEQFGMKYKTIALGDAQNDIQMLETADHGVIVLNNSHDGIPRLKGEKTGQITRTALEGPSGWNQAVLQLLEKFDS